MRKLLALGAAGLLLAAALAATRAAHAQAAPSAPDAQAAARPAGRRRVGRPELASGAKVWLGRYGEFEEFLRTAPIAKMGDIPVGVTHPKRAFFAPGGIAGSAALKHLPSGIQGGYWESYKSEVAAYKLDRILGLNMVPPTIERRVGSDLGSMQLWVENCKLLKDVDQAKGPSRGAWAKQVWRQRTFDNLIANIDRNAGNLLVDDELEPDPDRPLARVRHEHDALHEGDDAHRPRVLRAAQGARRGDADARAQALGAHGRQREGPAEAARQDRRPASTSSRARRARPRCSRSER